MGSSPLVRTALPSAFSSRDMVVPMEDAGISMPMARALVKVQVPTSPSDSDGAGPTMGFSGPTPPSRASTSAAGANSMDSPSTVSRMWSPTQVKGTLSPS